MKIEEAIQKVTDTIRRDIPRVIGNEAVNFVLDNFQRQGFQGESFVPWKKRKKETAKTRGKPVLTGSSALKRSIFVKKADEQEVIVGPDGNLPYARIHNEGGTITQAARSETFTRNRKKSGRFKKGTKPGRGFTFRQHTITIPQRQYIGDSPVLRERIKNACINTLKNVLK